MIVSVLTSTPVAVNYWKQERLIISLASHYNDVTTFDFWSSVGGSSTSPLARYTKVAEGSYYAAKIDVTDYVRTYYSGSPLVLHFYDDDEMVEYIVNVTIVGLINPASVIIPKAGYLSDMTIQPPQKILHTNGPDITVETRGGANPKIDGSTLTQPTALMEGVDDAPTVITTDEGSKTLILEKLKCGVRYAFVRWKSFTGATRAFTFEVGKVKEKVANSYNLMPEDSEYIAIKGREDEFSLILDGLNAYDLWYYGDIIHSSEVYVSLDDGATFERVEVTNKEVAIPDGDAFNGKLEVNVKFKRYDAVSM